MTWPSSSPRPIARSVTQLPAMPGFAKLIGRASPAPGSLCEWPLPGRAMPHKRNSSGPSAAGRVPPPGHCWRKPRHPHHGQVPPVRRPAQPCSPHLLSTPCAGVISIPLHEPPSSPCVLVQGPVDLPEHERAGRLCPHPARGHGRHRCAASPGKHPPPRQGTGIGQRARTANACAPPA